VTLAGYWSCGQGRRDVFAEGTLGRMRDYLSEGHNWQRIGFGKSSVVSQKNIWRRTIYVSITQFIQLVSREV